MEFFDVIINALQTSFYTLGEAAWGGIIFAILMVALVSFLYSTKNGKKEKFIGNYYLFYMAIVFAIVGIVLTILLSNYIM